MPKAKIAYVCSECGADHAKWQGQCATCGEWNTLKEFRESSAAVGGRRERGREGYAGQLSAVTALGDISADDLPRIASGFGELDRVLGGGFVPGSVVLIGGDPGAGKSTLLLQVCAHLCAHKGKRVLYVTGEESLSQVALRGRRLQIDATQVQLAAETRIEALEELIAATSPDIVVIDSIQVMSVEHTDSAPGSVVQVRESAAALTRIAKRRDRAVGPVVILVGHVTKEGGLAGPKVLEHIIDSFLMLDSGTDARFRVLRALKNRFGTVNELGVFAMTERGLKEVANPSAIFLSRADEVAPGSVVTVVWEGSRALLLEAQALVDSVQSAYPRRIAVGIESSRLALQLAILHRHGSMDIGTSDVFVNIVGGVRVEETATDLALLLAVASSLRNRTLPRDLVVFGEVGLAGEVRPVVHGQERLREAAKHGFKRAIVPTANAPKQEFDGMQVIGATRLQDALDAAF